MTPRSQRLWIGYVTIGLVGVAFCGLIGRLIYINHTMSPKLMSYAERRLKSTISIPGRRGMIMDRCGRVLAGSQDLPTIYADPTLLEDHATVAMQLTGPLNMPFEKILRKLNEPTSRRYVELATEVDPADADAIQALIEEHEYRGLGIRRDPSRSYPMGSLGAHILGFVGKDGKGLEGIELTYNSVLQATPGKRVVYRDWRRRAAFQEPDSYVAPFDGKSVILTIDAAIQEVVERTLSQQVTKYEAECGVGIVMDVKTGEVLALACVPTYEPANAGNFPLDARRNRALTDPVEPGSIFKGFVMSMALAEGVTHPDEVINTYNGGFPVPGSSRYLSDHHPYASLTTTGIMAHSSNIGMAVLGLRLGNEKIYNGLRAFGFGYQTGIDLPGEGVGLLMPLAWWNHPYSTTSVPMGQELAVTPIQMINAYSSIINGGLRLQPRVIAAVISPDGEILEDRRETIVRGQSIDPMTSATMRHIFAEVVNDGTGKKCKLDKWQVMGKTGTAQVPRQGQRGYEPNAYLASFIGAAPERDPDIVALVMIRKPNRRIGYYGSQVALPAVKEILEFSLNYRNVPADPMAEPDAPEMAAATLHRR